MIRPSAPRAPHSLAIPSPSIPSIPKVHHSSHSFPSLSPRKRVLARPLVRRERSLDRDVYTSQIHQSRLPDESVVNPETTAHRRDDSVESGGFREGLVRVECAGQPPPRRDGWVVVVVVRRARASREVASTRTRSVGEHRRPFRPFRPLRRRSTRPSSWRRSERRAERIRGAAARGNFSSAVAVEGATVGREW